VPGEKITRTRAVQDPAVSDRIHGDLDAIALGLPVVAQRSGGEKLPPTFLATVQIMALKSNG
jgi:hypothetical protein